MWVSQTVISTALGEWGQTTISKAAVHGTVQVVVMTSATKNELTR